MSMRFRFDMIAVCCLLTLAGEAAAQEPRKPDLKPLLEPVRKVVQKYYPKAQVTLKDDTIHFEFNTRKFMIHNPTLTGEWQDAYEEPGPQKGGIHGEIEIRPGEYGGMAALPQTFNKHYFSLLMTAPHSKKLDCHLMVYLKYPRDVPKAFLEEFQTLVNGFEKHVGVRGK